MVCESLKLPPFVETITFGINLVSWPFKFGCPFVNTFNNQLKYLTQGNRIKKIEKFY